MSKKNIDFGETRVIECIEINLSMKDIIVINELKDFKFLLAGGSIFKMKSSYYLLSNDIAFLWVKK